MTGRDQSHAKPALPARATVSFLVVYLLLGLQRMQTQSVSFPGRLDLALISGILVYSLRLQHIRRLK